MMKTTQQKPQQITPLCSLFRKDLPVFPSIFCKFPNTSKFVNRLSSSFRVDKVDNIDMDALDGLDPMIVH